MHTSVAPSKALLEFCEKLKQDSQVLGIILFGSWARGNNRPESDVDLLILQTSGFQRTMEWFQGTAFELTRTTEKSAQEYWHNNPNDCAELWQVAHILFDRDGTVSRLEIFAKNLISQGKQVLSSEEVAHMRFDLDDQLQAAQYLIATDPSTASMLLHSKVLQLSCAYFDLRRFWTPAPKQRLTIIEKHNPRLAQLFRQFYQPSQDITELHALAKSIAILVLEY